MLRHAFRTGLILGAVCILSTPLLAQSFGRTGTARGGTGSAFGGATGGFGGGGMRGRGGFGTGGFGGGSFGTGGFGGFGGSGATGRGMGGSAFGGGTNMGGFVTQGQNQFMLGNQATGGFVGREAADLQQFFGGTMGNQAGLQAFQNQARRQQQFQRNQNNDANRGRGRGRDQSLPFRVSLQVGFTPPRAATSGLSGRLQGEIAQTLSSRVGVSNPTIDLAGQTVILRGTVATVEQKLLAEEILSLQPGVTTVTNELVVATPLPEPDSE